jgi:hypothetical protein
MAHIGTFSDQTRRIGSKLARARVIDAGHRAFGSDVHRYRIGPPLDLTIVTHLARQCRVDLPEAFVAFVTQVGHGSGEGRGAAAGPFYGIAPLPAGLAPVWGDGCLAEVPLIHAQMSDADWQARQHDLMVDDPALSETQADARFDAALARLYGGLLMLGHQGCQSYHALVLTGADRGRVVNLDLDGGRPHFAPDAHFLDWYERWLDGVLSGRLAGQTVPWFGYET